MLVNICQVLSWSWRTKDSLTWTKSFTFSSKKFNFFKGASKNWNSNLGRKFLFREYLKEWQREKKVEPCSLKVSIQANFHQIASKTPQKKFFTWDLTVFSIWKKLILKHESNIRARNFEIFPPKMSVLTDGYHEKSLCYFKSRFSSLGSTWYFFGWSFQNSSALKTKLFLQKLKNNEKIYSLSETFFLQKTRFLQ